MNCGARLAAKSRFCPECGTQVGAEPGETAVQQVPPSETGPVPVDEFVAERKFFGVPPSTLLFGIGVAGLTLGILLLATGHVAWGLVLLSFSFGVLALFVSQTRRLPGQASGVARASVAALDAVRARAGAAVETVAAHGSARIDLARLRREASELAGAREGLLHELGEAVHGDNRTATKDLKKKLTELDEEIKAKEEEMEKVASQAQERIGQAQLRVQPTQVLPGVEEAPQPDEPPEPARVPEPYPPPGEADPPEPPRVPEPYPDPGEADPPEPARVPEPGPGGRSE
jgi:hypothetical protein